MPFSCGCYSESKGFFLKMGGLGSSYLHITTLWQNDIRNIHQKDSSFLTEAEVHASFVQASGGFSESKSQTSEVKEMMKKSEMITHGVSSCIQLDLQFEGQAQSPGLVSVIDELICGAIPSSFLEQKKEYYLVLAQKRKCCVFQPCHT